MSIIDRIARRLCGPAMEELTRENERLRREVERARSDVSDATMAAAVGEAVIAVLRGEPVSDFAESFGPVNEAQTLMWTVQALQGDISAQRRVIMDACAHLRVTDDSEADWPKLPESVRRMAEENERLTAEVARLRTLARSATPTKAEAEMLALVKAEPGLLAGEYARKVWDVFAANHGWMRKIEDPRCDDERKPLSALHKLGLVRREKVGQTYRYWPAEGA